MSTAKCRIFIQYMLQTRFRIRPSLQGQAYQYRYVISNGLYCSSYSSSSNGVNVWTGLHFAIPANMKVDGLTSCINLELLLNLAIQFLTSAPLYVGKHWLTKWTKTITCRHAANYFSVGLSYSDIIQFGVFSHAIPSLHGCPGCNLKVACKWHPTFRLYMSIAIGQCLTTISQTMTTVFRI